MGRYVIETSNKLEGLTAKHNLTIEEILEETMRGLVEDVGGVEGRQPLFTIHVEE